jgi:hypothetical protein
MMRPNRPAPETAVRMAPLPLPLSLADAPVELAVLEPDSEPVDEAPESEPFVSEYFTSNSIEILPMPVADSPVAVESAPEAVLEEPEPAVVETGKKEAEMQEAWQEAYAAVSSSVPLP